MTENGVPTIGVILAKLMSLQVRLLRLDAAKRANTLKAMAELAKKSNG